MVSMSITSMFPKPVRARSLSSSHPRPPAPTTRIRLADFMKSYISAAGSKSPGTRNPGRSSRGLKLFLLYLSRWVLVLAMVMFTDRIQTTLFVSSLALYTASRRR